MKRLFTLLTALCICLSMAGCAANDASEAEDSATSPATTNDGAAGTGTGADQGSTGASSTPAP